MTDRTYNVNVEGIGNFVCRRRTMRVAVAISAEYNRLTEGASTVSKELDAIADFLSFLAVVVVSGPEGWDPYLCDPDSAQEIERLQSVYRAIKDAEARFRAGADKDAEKSGEIAQ